jgi:hypothetical protein
MRTLSPVHLAAALAALLAAVPAPAAGAERDGASPPGEPAAPGPGAAAPGVPCDGGPSAFGAEVLAVAEKHLPGRGLERAEGGGIRRGAVPVGLDRLRERICAATPPLPPERREALARGHLEAALKILEPPATRIERDWLVATRDLLVQLLPEDLAALDPALVTKPLVPGVVVAGAIDTGESWEYLRAADLARWTPRLEDRSVFFLAARMRMEMNAPIRGLSGGDVEGRRFLVIDEGDGFEAARLLQLELRREVARQLGDPYYASIASRGRLVMWSAYNTDEFHAFAREQARRNWTDAPDALTPEVLRVLSWGPVEVVKEGEKLGRPRPPPPPEDAGLDPAPSPAAAAPPGRDGPPPPPRRR